MSQFDPPQSPPLPYFNAEFLKSPEARVIRILAEYVEPATRLRRHRVQDTIVFFGSARSLSPGVAPGKPAVIKQEIARSVKPTPEIEARLARAEQSIKLARYYYDAMELARRVTEWSKGLTSSHHFIV